MADQAQKSFEEIQQTDAEIKLCAHVRSKVEECRTHASRVASESIWMTNIAYLLGADGVSFDSKSRQFMPINRAMSGIKKNRIHINKILPTIQNKLARICKNPPKWDVRPESNDTDDKEAARLSLQVLNTLWEQLSINSKRLFLYMWVLQCGHAWMKVSWDVAKGKWMPEVQDPKTGEMMLPGYEGEVRCDVVSPFEIFPNPSATSEEEVLDSWLIQAKVRKLDYFRTRYPEKGHLVKEEEAWLMSIQYEQKINAINNKSGGSGTSQMQMKNSAIELVKYEARSEKYPNGRMIITASGILLEDKELPVGEIPFRQFCDVIIGGKLFPESTITHLRPIQDQFNHLIRQRASWTKKLLAGKYVAARGSGIAQESLDDESGEVIYHDVVPTDPAGGKPTPLQIPNIPQWSYTEEDKLNAMFNDISGVQEIDKGNVEQAGLPAIGMQLMTENSDTRIGIMTEQHEHAWAGIGSLILKYVQAFYIMPRKLKIAGKNLQYTVKQVSGADLKDNTDVTVIRGSTLPGSKTLKRQEIINLHQSGYLGDPKDPKVVEKVLGMLEFGDVGEAWQDYGLDMAQIQKGIDAIEAGQTQLPLNEFDNHALWIQELNRYRKGDKFSSLTPELQQEINELIEEHVQWIVKLTAPPEQAPPLPPMVGDNSGMPQPPPGAH